MSEPAPPRTAIVVGAGVVGLASAIALQARGVAVTLVGDEARWQRAASWGNAGHIATEQVAPLASWDNIRSLPRRLFSRGGPVALPPSALTAWAPFGLRLAAAASPARFAHGTTALKGLLADALPAWQRLLAAAGAPQLLGDDGHFIAWESAATAAHGRAAWAAADTGSASFRDVTADERAQLQALVRVPLAGAIRFAGSGRIRDIAALEQALRRHFAALGGVACPARVAGLTMGEGARVHLDDGRQLAADLAVVAAGVQSAALLAPLGFNLPLIAERGYHLEGDAPAWPADLPPVVFEDRSLIFTRFGHGLRAASITEFARPDTPADPRKWQRLAQHLGELGVSLSAPRQWMGARPTLPDYLPAIGLVRPALACAFGHQHLGLTLAAISAERLAAQVMGDVADLAAFAPDRFR
ncbi:MAG: FAD-binding oxidoreductase [Sandarakinorhabdus sp.]|nr:FAD-binding oxidoreductase [Sandarakinorhabdus sp.]